MDDKKKSKPHKPLAPLSKADLARVTGAAGQVTSGGQADTGSTP